MFFCRAAYSFPAPLHLSFFFSVLIIAFASSSLFPSPHSIYVSSLSAAFSISPSLHPHSRHVAPLAVTESHCLPMLHTPPKFIHICTHRPSLVGPHTAYVPAKCNVTAPPKPSFRAITGQISPSKAPVCSLIDGTPAFFLRVHASVLLFCGRAHSCVCFYIPTFIYVCTCVSLCVCSRPDLEQQCFPCQ